MDTNIESALQTAPLALKGEFVWGSNHTFLVEVQGSAEPFLAVYKPTQGERPLWDFPEASLALREAAAYVVSQALGWDLVPPTFFRPDGPFGPGSLQLFIDHDPEYHYFNLTEEDRQRLRPVALFDILVNNADRKGSHMLFDPQDHLWLIDHGICFHVDPKLRTVIWDFAGEPIPAVLLDRLRSLQGRTTDWLPGLAEYLLAEELAALEGRLEGLLANPVYPLPPGNRRAFPYPPV